MRAPILPLAALLLGLSAPSATHAENLLDIYGKAVANDARFAAQRGAYQAGRERLPQGRALLLPTLSVNAEKGRSDSEIKYSGSTSFESGARKYDERQYSVTLTQPLYRMQNIAGYQQAKAQARVAEAQWAMAAQDLILRTAQAYVDVLTAQQDVATAAAHVKSTRGQFEQTQAKLGVGAATRLEASEARARADVARSQLIAAQHELLSKRQAVARITNEMPGTLDEFAPNLPLVAPAGDVTEWLTLAEQNNPQLQALRDGLEVAKREVQRARGGHHPNIDLIAERSSGYSTGSVYTSADSDTEITSARVRLDLPLYQGGVVSSRVREAAGNLSRAEGELEDARRDIKVQINQQFNGAVSGVERTLALGQALISSREAERANRIGFGVGARNFVDVLNAEQQAFDVAREAIKAKHEFVLSALRLKALAGVLREDELASLNSYLRPPETP